MRRVIVAILAWGVMWSAWGQAPAPVVASAGALERDRDALLATLRTGGAALLLRHSQTVPGVGGPPNFKLGDCKTQRNLSHEGVAQAKRIGELLRASKVSFARALSSQWCRCADSAKHIAPAFVTWSPLNSFFDDFSLRDSQTRAVKNRLLSIPKNETWLMVTHQVNITAVTGVSPAMGEGVVIRVGAGGIEVVGLLAM
jgi:phosphohistidine phosphatase SixA